MLKDLTEGLLSHQHRQFVGSCTFAERFTVPDLNADSQSGMVAVHLHLTRPSKLVAASCPAENYQPHQSPTTGQDQYEPRNSNSWLADHNNTHLLRYL